MYVDRAGNITGKDNAISVTYLKLKRIRDRECERVNVRVRE